MKTSASLIDEEYSSIDTTPWWVHYLRKLFPFKRRKVVLLEDVLPLLDAMQFTLDSHNTDPEACVDKLSEAYTKFIFKHPLPRMVPVDDVLPLLNALQADPRRCYHEVTTFLSKHPLP